MSVDAKPLTLLNFGHPLTPEQVAAIENLLGLQLERIVALPVQFDHGSSFVEQARALMDSVGLSPEDWQTTPLLVNLPGHSVIAALVLAELHGRCGYFPAVLRLRPAEGPVSGQFDVAEVVDLQKAREWGRVARTLGSTTQS